MPKLEDLVGKKIYRTMPHKGDRSYMQRAGAMFFELLGYNGHDKARIFFKKDPNDDWVHTLHNDWNDGNWAEFEGCPKPQPEFVESEVTINEEKLYRKVNPS